jgi:hypothetical protein
MGLGQWAHWQRVRILNKNSTLDQGLGEPSHSPSFDKITPFKTGSYVV